MLTIPLTETQADRQQALLQMQNLAVFLETNHPALTDDPAWQTYRAIAEQATTDLWDLYCVAENPKANPGTPHTTSATPNP